MNKQTRILFNFKKASNSDACYNMDEHALTDRPTPDAKVQMLPCSHLGEASITGDSGTEGGHW